MFDLMEKVMDVLMPPLMIACVVLMAGLVFIGLPMLAYSAWQGSKSPTFELRKDEWTCMATHRETYTTHVMVGKVLVPQVHTRTVCDQWSRR